MADYYPLLSRALDALPDRSPEMRRAVYERARGALIGQLRSLDPPLSEDDIDREREALDEAIGRLEAGYDDDPLEPEEMPEAATLPAGPSLAEPARPPLPEPGPPEPLLAPLPPRREPPRPAEDDATSDAGAARRPRLEVRRPRDRAATLRKTAGVLALAVVVGLIAVAAWLLRDKPSDLPLAGADGTARQVEEGDAKYGERVGGERQVAERQAAERPGGQPQAPAQTAQSSAPGSAQPARPPEPAAAPRAILYEEDAANPQAPRAFQGRVTWRLDSINAGQGQPLETVVRAVVEVPEAALSLTLTLRRNLDTNLPASHTAELVFAAGQARTVRDAGVLQLKAEESARGAPLAGLPVPVRDNLFLIGLSNPPADVERNTDLILRRQWFDIPLRYVSGGRAVLTFEKGAAGERVLADAFAQWR